MDASAGDRNHQLATCLSLAQQHFRAGRRPEAAIALARGVDLAPQSFRAHNNLAAVYVALGCHVEAEREWQATLKLRPDDAGVKRNLEQLRRRRQGPLAEYSQPPKK